MKLLVIIPAFNESPTIADVVRGVPRSLAGLDEIDVLVVDDGSTDGSAEIARAAGARVISHGTNRGVGAAFSTGVNAALAAGADVVVNMDGDGQFDPADIPRLLQPILDGQAGFVTCTRFADPRLVPAMPAIKKWGNSVLTRLLNRLVPGHRFTDVSCGFRAYTRDTLQRLVLLGDFTYTHETFLNLASQHVRMAEVPLRIRGTREYGTSRVAGSIPRYAVRTLPIILRTVRDLRPLAFFGGIGLVVFTAGVAMGGFMLVHLLLTGATSPYRSVLTGSAVGLILGFLLMVLALLADMLLRYRRILEEVLYRLRKLDAGRDEVRRTLEPDTTRTSVRRRGIHTLPMSRP